MVADIFTKPLQGSAFWKFRNAVLNIQSQANESFLAPLIQRANINSQECVGNDEDPERNSLGDVRKQEKEMDKDVAAADG
jgi:hypothetical protein